MLDWRGFGTSFFFLCVFVLEFVVLVTETSRAGPLVEYERRIANSELVEGDSCQVECVHFTLMPDLIDELNFPSLFYWQNQNAIGRYYMGFFHGSTFG